MEKDEAEESPEEPVAPVQKPKGKAAPKPRAKAATSAKAAGAAKKRKGRSADDKLQENAPVAKPFFVEDGSEWHGSDIGTSCKLLPRLDAVYSSLRFP